jgi:hypothetical protein
MFIIFLHFIVYSVTITRPELEATAVLFYLTGTTKLHIQNLLIFFLISIAPTNFQVTRKRC